MLEGTRKLKQMFDQELSGSYWATEEQIRQHNAMYAGRAIDIEACVRAGEVIRADSNGTKHYSLKEYDLMESVIAEKALEMKYYTPIRPVPEDKINALIKKYETEENNGFELHSGQKNAVRTMVNNAFCIITGGPGTGKTTVLTCAAYVMRHADPTISLAFTAPTGKAARRVTESSGENACTVHKKFGLGYDKSKSGDRFYEDVLIIDESSMNDLELTYQVFSAMPRGKRMVWVGDTDQLPSVGPGAVLRDLIASGAVPVAKLTHTFRQDNSSVLFQNIVNIREGKAELVEGPDFHPIFLEEDADRQDIKKRILEEFKKGMDKYGADQTVVLIPYRVNRMLEKTEEVPGKDGNMVKVKKYYRDPDYICSNGMNNLIQKIANPGKKPWFTHLYAGYDNDGNRTGIENVIFFKPGDIVMQNVNRKECANGDIGKVIQVDANGVLAQFDDGTVSYGAKDLEQLSLAYSMSVNKSQGSEYKYVVMVLLDDFDSMLNRNILYTGVTRAKAECSVIYQQKALERSVSTQADDDRKTLLKEKLVALEAGYQMHIGMHLRREKKARERKTAAAKAA